MSGVNRVILLGRLGKDVEAKSLANGQSVSNFSIATSEAFKDKTTGERKETTEWHNCVAWGALSDIASKYLRKGDQVYVEGKMKTRSWEKDGITRYATEVLLDKIVLIGGNKSTNESSVGQGHTSTQQPNANANQGFDPESDLPF